ncbi:MAG: TIM barrel protein [Candidatus Eremiobacteraeota bacterium]|nr:TIM barrel protein [Candidatus Eremiobacteraeota bacterium]
MKLACASGAFDRAIASGELTQLEFLEVCAHQLTCDGVVLDARHFPRSDDDYLAQIKKLATDWGLSIAALSDSRFFGASPEEMERTLARALALGAPLIAAPLGRLLDGSWSDQLERLNAATALAKAHNVTLAVRNVPDTFAAGTHDYRRTAKEADSAWLRYGPEPQALEAGSDAGALRDNTVLLWSDAATQTERSIADVTTGFRGFLGFLAVDHRDGAADAARMIAGVRQWRAALAQNAQ